MKGKKKMKSLGIIRKIDELGRIVLPKELRDNFNLSQGDSLEIYTDKDSTIVLKKHSPSCIFCGSESYLKEYKGNLICRQCIDDLR